MFKLTMLSAAALQTLNLHPSDQTFFVNGRRPGSNSQSYLPGAGDGPCQRLGTNIA